MYTDQTRPSRSAPTGARLGTGAEVRAKAAAGEGKSLENREAGCDGGAQREPGLESSSRVSTTPPPMSTDTGEQRGGRKDGSGRSGACKCRGHRVTTAAGEGLCLVSCCCGVYKPRT